MRDTDGHHRFEEHPVMNTELLGRTARAMHEERLRDAGIRREAARRRDEARDRAKVENTGGKGRFGRAA
ncbi:hypothetical protein PWG71_21915 [Nocardiopsis sp. N85]|uniref:hypothetical protein n=1 Tax=Nocardiopsis sp. N85 TaxID=3029400 RepID=UPI00237F5C40|nr:hypothetical protein [Nocardiopsis sp. N85]MDE3724056.1 hypothetical protein [Nocardiopsis sp. N85]